MGEFVKIEVLGPLQVRSGDSVIDVGSPRHHEVLAALAVDAGRVVSSDALLERVWGEARRGSSTANLHAAISRLRGWLQTSAGQLEIVTVSPGYRLDPAEAVDAVVFQNLLTDARKSRDAGDPDRARTQLVAALELWRGPAYADIRLPFSDVEAARLDGQRLAALELLVDVELAQGQLGSVLDRLAALVREQPLREAFRGQQMLALYRSGRQAEALEAYANLRNQLLDELGIDPAPQLQDLHLRILEQDQTLLADAAQERLTPHASRDPLSPSTNHPAARPDATTEDDSAARPPAETWRSEVVVPPDELVGRGRDVDYLRELIVGTSQKIVTITGVGGVGKTRLAYAVARGLQDAYPDGVAVVSLAALTDPDLVLPAVGRALGLTAVEGLDPLEAVTQHLRARRVLLVLDNFEHVLGAGPALARLVAMCPGVSVLVTSRTTLRVRGELHYQLSPLSLPSVGAEAPAAILESAAVSLFVDRAREAQPDFDLDDDNAAAVAAVCRRLAGIPLALELAAARVHLLDPETIMSRLDQVMSGSGARDLPARQRTMHAAIDWSYQLLDPGEQETFRRLAVFNGGFTLEAVEAIARRLDDRDGPGDGRQAHDKVHDQVLDHLENLVAHSLVIRDHDHARITRFRMLEPVSQFAAACLTGAEEQAARDAHLRYFLGLAEATEPGYRGTGTTDALAVTHREHANLVGAIEWALSSSQGDLAGRLVWAMWLFWWLRGHLLEGRRLTTGVLELDLPDPLRARAHAVMGAMTFAQGDTVLARHWMKGTEVARAIGDIEAEAYNVAGEGLIALAEERLDEAQHSFVETIRLTEAAGLATEWLWTLAHVWQATVVLLRGRPRESTPLLQAALEAARRRDDPLAIYIALFTSVQVAIAEGELVTARAQLEEGILLSVGTGDMANLAYFLEALAVVESLDDNAARVPVLQGGAERLRETVGGNVYGYYQPDETLLVQALSRARAELGTAFDASLDLGRAMGPEELVAYATQSSVTG